MSFQNFSKKEDLLTVDMFKSLNLFGVSLTDHFGNELQDSVLQRYIDIGISRIEQEIYCPVNPTELTVQLDFMSKNYSTYMYIQTNVYPIISVSEVNLNWGSSEFPSSDMTVIQYPASWFKVYSMSGQIQLLPTYGTLSQLIYRQISQLSPMLSGQTYIPAVLEVKYTAGLTDTSGQIDPLINNTIGLIAETQLLQRIGDIGSLSGPGVASESLQIDGLNQNISTTATLGTLYKVRIDNNNKIIEQNIKIIKKNFNRINFTTA